MFQRWQISSRVNFCKLSNTILCFRDGQISSRVYLCKLSEKFVWHSVWCLHSCIFQFQPFHFKGADAYSIFRCVSLLYFMLRIQVTDSTCNSLNCIIVPPSVLALQAPLSNRLNHPAPGQGPTTSNTPAGVTASPSCFAPPGHHGQPSSLLSVSISGTQYAASSSSPAASGGTSAFRDGRLTSPSWN